MLLKHHVSPTVSAAFSPHCLSSPRQGVQESRRDGADVSAELDESFFEPTLSDVQAHHASVVARSKRLNEAPLLTAKHRDEERAERDKRKAEKWPTTTIRVRFSDGTVIQSTFPSSSP